MNISLHKNHLPRWFHIQTMRIRRMEIDRMIRFRRLAIRAFGWTLIWDIPGSREIEPADRWR